MAQIIKEVSLDVSCENMIPAILAKQYDDNSRFLKVTIKDRGEVLSVDASSAVTINITRADGHSAAEEGSVNEDGTVLVPLSKWLLSVSGTTICDISVTDKEKRKLTTTLFKVNVEAAACDESDQEYDPEDDSHTTLLSRCSEIVSEKLISRIEALESSINSLIMSNNMTHETLSSRISVLESQLNSISLDVDEDNNLTYIKIEGEE